VREDGLTVRRQRRARLQSGICGVGDRAAWRGGHGVGAANGDSAVVVRDEITAL
jgi:hypothetical protein